MTRYGEVKYIGDSLQSLVPDDLIDATYDLMEDITHTARSVLFDTARAATPVGRTGAVRESWLASPVSREGDRFTTSVFNDHWVANFLNYGTQAHEIDPKAKRADLTPEGPRRRAHVRGIRPHHMIERATETLREVIEPMSYRDRVEWKYRAEQAIERAKFSKRIIGH
jgi:hypothetical protein